MSKRSSSLTETKSLISKDHLSKFDERRPAGYPSDKEIPVVLVLKRKAIRVYPDNQKVVLYYSQALDKYVSIPFGPKSDVLGSPLNESRKPKKEKDDKDGAHKALQKYPNIAKYYKKAKEEQPERRGLRKVVRKLTPKEIMNLPPEERKVAYNMAQQMVSASDMPLSHKLGVKAGLATLNFMAKRKDRRKKAKALPSTEKSTPTPSAKGANVMPPSMGKTQVSTRPSVAESYKKKVNAMKGKQIDEGVTDYLDAGAEAIVPYYSAAKKVSKGDYSGATKDAIIDTGLLASGAIIGKVGQAAYKGYKARKAAKAVSNVAKTAKASKGLRVRTRLNRFARRHGGKAAAIGAGLKGAVDVLGSATDSSKPAQQDYQFALQPKVGSPGQRGTVDLSTPEGKVARSMIQQMRESSNIDKIKYIVENNINSYDMTFEGNDSTINLNNRVAKKVLQIYETLNTKNQKKFSKMLNENATTFKQAINFVIRH